jgi:hypothetical protein
VLKHPHVISARTHVRLDLQKVYVVNTDLAVTPDEPDFDKAAYDSLVRAARASLEQNPHYADVRLERVAR